MLREGDCDRVTVADDDGDDAWDLERLCDREPVGDIVWLRDRVRLDVWLKLCVWLTVTEGVRVRLRVTVALGVSCWLAVAA